VSGNKLVERLTGPVPLELAEFGLAGTLARLGEVTLRGVTHSPDGGVIADYTGPFEEPQKLATWLSEMPGVVEHGLFPPAMVAEVIVARGDGVERIAVAQSEERG
jgi:ribose 5-phosphate isomerase A